MVRILWAGTFALALATAACGNSDAASTRVIEGAAVERARQELGVGANVPLKATVWTAGKRTANSPYAAPLSSPDGAATPIRPQQFPAHGDPDPLLHLR